MAQSDLQRIINLINSTPGLSQAEKQSLRDEARGLANANGNLSSTELRSLRQNITETQNSKVGKGGGKGGGNGGGGNGGGGGGGNGGGGNGGGGNGGGSGGGSGGSDAITDVSQCAAKYGSPGNGFHWELINGACVKMQDAKTEDNKGTAPGSAWVWDGTRWTRPAQPNDGKPYIWDDDSGWVEDVAKMQARQDAYETLQSWFSYYGIDDATAGGTSLSSLIWSWVQQDKSADWMRLELRKTEQYKARFPGMDALSKKGMAISEAEYISNERAYLQVMKAAGMPKGFYDDRQDFANFMVAEVSPQELASRVQIAKDYVQLYAPQSVKDQLRGLYGFTNDQMAAYVLDTSQDKMKSLAAIEAEYTTRKAQAQVGGAAIDAGYGLSTTLRDQIAAMGYDYNQSAAGIYRTQQQANPYARLGSLYGEQTSTDELLQETFGLGGAAETATKKKKLASRERAAFGGTSAIGASSLGTNQAGRV